MGNHYDNLDILISWKTHKKNSSRQLGISPPTIERIECRSGIIIAVRLGRDSIFLSLRRSDSLKAVGKNLYAFIVSLSLHDFFLIFTLPVVVIRLVCLSSVLTLRILLLTLDM